MHRWRQGESGTQITQREAHGPGVGGYTIVGKRRSVETFLVEGLCHGGTVYLIRSQTFPRYLSNQKNMHKGRKRIKDIGGFIRTAEPLSLFGLLKSIQGELNIPFRGCK